MTHRDFSPYEDKLEVIVERLTSTGSMDMKTTAELAYRLLVEVDRLKKIVKSQSKDISRLENILGIPGE